MTKQKHYQDLVRHHLVKKLVASQILAVFSGNTWIWGFQMTMHENHFCWKINTFCTLYKNNNKIMIIITITHCDCPAHYQVIQTPSCLLSHDLKQTSTVYGCWIFNIIIPWARLGSESIAHSAFGLIGCWLRGHEGERNCFCKIQLVGQKYRDKNNFS